MITKNTPINIRNVGNGFVVTPALWGRDVVTIASSDSDTLVFESLANLQQFIAGHFGTAESCAEFNSKMTPEILGHAAAMAELGFPRGIDDLKEPK